MKARNLLEQFAHGPESLKVLGKAFDDAWLTIEYQSLRSVSDQPSAPSPTTMSSWSARTLI
jgi:hypothetical protein